MFNWFKNLFNTKQVESAEEHPEEDVKDISEPAISLLKCVQDNPERFMCDKKIDSVYYDSYNLRLYDKKEKVLIKARFYSEIRRSHGDCHTEITYREVFTDTGVFTKDESEYLYRNIAKLYKDIRKAKEDNERNMGRKRLSDIYCK